MTDENTVDTQEADVQDQPAPQEGQQGTDLNISDLAALKSIVEIATQRGAFKANELEAVGKTFNKLNTFLETVAAQQKEE
jgi:hypothetical protein